MQRGARVNLPFRRLAQLSARGELGVPLAGFLYRPLECAEVDEDEAETLRITFSPFVVVQQAPGVVRADGNALLVGACDGAEITTEESSAAVVGNNAHLVGYIAVGATVLGDLNGLRFISGVDLSKEVVETVRPDLPSHLGFRAVGSFLRVHLEGSVGIGREADRALIVVHSKVVERHLGDFHVTGTNAHLLENLRSSERLGIFAFERRIEEPVVTVGLVSRAAGLVGLRAGAWNAIGHGDGGSRLGCRVRGLDGTECLSLRKIYHVGGLHECIPVFTSRSVDTGAVAKPGEDVRLVENAPGIDAIPEMLNDKVGVVDEVSGGVAIGPATFIFERLGKIPVVNGHERADAGLVQLVENALVVIEAFGIGGARSVGLNARPTDGEAIAG